MRRFELLAGLGLVVPFLFFLLLAYPHTPASFFPYFAFGVASSALVLVAALRRPSFFICISTGFLTIGFFIKFIAHQLFGIAFIEPVGGFDGSSAQWDTALSFAAAGLAGCCAAAFAAGEFRSFAVIGSGHSSPGSGHWLIKAALALLLVLSACVYVANYHWAILRIGYAPEIGLPHPLYPILSFMIAWGCLVGALTLLTWLLTPSEKNAAIIVHVSALLGFVASLTMGSRIQFLLYVFASVLVVINWTRHRGIGMLPTWPVAKALSASAVLFVISIGIVSVQRVNNFQPAPSTGTTEASPAAAASKSTDNVAKPSEIGSPQIPAVPVGPSRLMRITTELKSLLVMRWIGMEGVMTNAGASSRLGLELLRTGLAENPAAGVNGLYQRLSGDPYRDVKGFTFLTLPGPIGVASYSGNLALIATFMFILMLTGHCIEWTCAAWTKNIGATTVAGVSLSYLVVQMGFPRTLLVYAAELMIAISMIAAVRILLPYLVQDRASQQDTAKPG